MRRFLVFFFVICFLHGCSHEAPNTVSPNANTGWIVFNVVWPKNVFTGKIAYIQAVSSITAYVYSGGSEVTRNNLTHAGSRGQADITITAKENYRVVLAAFENALVKYIGSDEDVDVTTGGTTTVDITMTPITPIMKSPSITGSNTFSISWTSNKFASAYKLEEDDNGYFTSPTTVSSSADSTVSFTDKSASNYFYHVCSVTPYGNSPWSEVKSVGVSDEGTIRIDIPWPEEEPVKLSIPTKLLVVWYGGYKVSGEVINGGSQDANNVMLNLVARNSSGIYIGTLTIKLDTIRAKSSKGFIEYFYDITSELSG